MLRFVSALSLLVALPIGALAQSAPLKTAEVARNLYDLGVSQSDPLLIMSAAKLRKGLVLDAVARAPEGAESPAGLAPHLDWEAMLKTAEDLAVGNKALLGLIDDIRVERSKGLTSGPVFSIASIKSGGTDTYAPFPFTGEAYAEVYLEGAGGADLNLFVYDQKDRLVCSDSDASQIAYCGWTPSATAEFKIIVKNKGPKSASYSLMTN